MADDELVKRAAQLDADRAKQDSERVEFDARRVAHDEERVQVDVERAEQDTQRSEYDTAIAVGIKTLASQAERLAGTVADLNKRLNTSEETQDQLTNALRQIELQQHRNVSQRRFNRWATVVGIAFTGIVMVLGYALYRIDHNASKISDLQVRTSDRVLCPLYGLFIASIEDAPPLAADRDGDGTVTRAEQKRYDAAVAVILNGHETLECKPVP